MNVRVERVQAVRDLYRLRFRGTLLASALVCGGLVIAAPARAKQGLQIIPHEAVFRPVGMSPVATVPLPVPRPHFPGDDAVSRPVPPSSPALPPTSPALATPPAGGTAESTAAPCLEQLKTQGITFEAVSLGSQPNPLCAIADPVRMSGLEVVDGAVGFPDKPTIACATGAVFADFVRALLNPLAKGSYGSPIRTVSTGPGFDCRTRDHIPGAKLSAHAQGLAIDIAEIGLVDGRKIDVGKAETETDRMFDRAARAGACGFFHTALGPGADSFHETHWHFDLLARGSKGDAKFCE